MFRSSRARQRVQARLADPGPDLWKRWQTLQLKRLVGILSIPKLPELARLDDLALDQRLMGLLFERLERDLAEHRRLTRVRVQFDTRMAHSRQSQEQAALCLQYGIDLGAGFWQQLKDRAAMQRYLDAAALNDRQDAQRSALERQMIFIVRRLTLLLDRSPTAGSQSAGTLGHASALLDALRQELVHPQQQVALLELDVALSCAMESTASSDQLARFTAMAIDREASPWVQRAALRALARVDSERLKLALADRFSDPEPEPFVRAAAVELWLEQLPQLPRGLDLRQSILHDPAPLVRQRLAAQLCEQRAVPPSLQLDMLTRLSHDREPSVRSVAITQLAALQKLRPATSIRVRDLLRAHLKQERDAVALRSLLAALERLAIQFRANPLLTERADALFAPVLDALADRFHNDDSPQVRRWIAAARERWLVALLPSWSQTADALTQGLAAQQRIDLRALPAALEQRGWMRVLAVLAQREQHLEVTNRGNALRIHRGHRFGFRLWRLLHEARNPSPDKRQGFRHTVGRHWRGTHRAPSPAMAEVSPTRVPGEPLMVGSEQSWRPYLPLLDECLQVLDQEGPTAEHQIYTSDGVTHLRPPKGLRAQLRAWWTITRRYARLAALRNWTSDADHTPARYLNELRALGFEIVFEPHVDPITGNHWSDPGIHAFFDEPDDQRRTAGTSAQALALLPVPAVLALLDSFWQHAQSTYDNTLPELIAFLAVLSAAFIGRLLWSQHRIRRARQVLPLVIGGWGTRGKSGTERLKAAMLTGAGYSVFSKTTGCEAMFVLNRPFRALKEFFLFRPYDKATIWEQADMVRLASKLDVDVFLWECMGLTPSYVRVLQRDWMRDDLATVTNTFPDHEDLQGPAGINIPEVMGEFIPERSVLVTSEETMLPLLKDRAVANATELDAVGWYEAGTLTPDVLQRFPYEEHPYNIALVLAVADRLGIDRDLAVKEMADQMVADLGVLKRYPEACVDGRRISFIMGMSANERFGALSNWERMGLAEATPDDHPERWTATLVNNRADRVARSQIFARLLVDDLAVDQNVLIGTNLKGMYGYLKQAFDDYTDGLDLWGTPSDVDSNDRALARFDAMAAARRICCSEATLQARLAVMASTGPAAARDGGTDTNPPNSDRWSLQLTAEFQQFRALRERVATADPTSRSVVNAAVKEQLWDWFNGRLLIIDDPYLSGEDVLKTLIPELPQGLQVQLMGMQNIKGTGLDFVYRWQQWEQVHGACDELIRNASQRPLQPARFEHCLDELLSQTNFGLLETEAVAAACAAVKPQYAAMTATQRARVQRLEARLVETPTQINPSVAGAPSRSNPLRRIGATLRDAVEALLDPGDAVQRRKTADRVYRDLAAHRISTERAIDEIKRLNRRQKGGWLRDFGRR
ncbi:MAG: hypothetical protein AAF648_05095 [Pseudomonadota bacterium]